ncbi:hypothetical protein FACS1894167_11490 [Synergistales bacterium]|nr:hypothetical protein FACS1894167_11490 [Synergistales bacterium]
MYGYDWTDAYGLYKLDVGHKIEKEIRPVFKEELDYFDFGKRWSYPDTDAPLLWAEGIRRYVLNGECVAEAVGGGFYTKPAIKFHRDGLALQPVDIDALWGLNERIMLGLEQKAIAFIRETYDKYRARGMEFVTAFSGGKDSLALLDLVSKALPPESFYVVFNNTGMELSCTLDAVERAKEHWSSLRFYEAKSHLAPEDSWDAFGPPGRRMRWCCSVHKSTPTILKLREITGDCNVKVALFDGVRAEESLQRAAYDIISEGAKNINQVNCRPLFYWNSAELFLYLFHGRILMNKAYRYGMNRVGCTICPLSSGWRDNLCNGIFPDEISSLLSLVESYADNVGIKQSERTSYIEKNGWRTRMGGRSLPNGGNRVNEVIDENHIRFDFSSATQAWLSVSVMLGSIVEKNNNQYQQFIGGKEYTFTVSDDGLSVSCAPYSQMDRFVVSHLRGAANKVAYCMGCKACEAQCPANAFVIDGNGKIFIREDKCTHCSHCIEFTNGKGCLVAKSLKSSVGGIDMKLSGIDRYKTFGLRREFLEHFFAYKSDCFTVGQLGNRQYDSLKAWLCEAELLSASNKGKGSGMPTPLFDKLERLGVSNPLTWAVIWTNLAYNSVIVRWYMFNAPTGEVYEKNDMVFMLGDDGSQSTKQNAIAALCETLRHSPIGSVLKQGIPISSGRSYKFAKTGWETPDAVAILYALYRWAEATGRYAFTLAQLDEARGNPEVPGVDPVSIFGLQPESFKDILRDIALRFDKHIRVSFAVDLDSVKLSPEITSVDVLDLAIRQEA